MRTITSFNVSWTAEHEQYWQGHGIAGSEYTHCATGVGETLREAFGDALEDLAQQDIEVSGTLESEMQLELASQAEMLDLDIVQGYCDAQGNHLGQVDCADCEGSGTIDADTNDERECGECNGTGAVEDVLEDPDCAVCAGDWHYYVSIDVQVSENVCENSTEVL